MNENYIVVRMDFQFLDASDFENAKTFVKAFCRELLRRYRKNLDSEIKEQIKSMRNSDTYVLADLFICLSEWCEETEKTVILIIDEVDSASNNQVFLDFLAQLRGYYLDRHDTPTFQSVILAGVHDIRNLRQKICSDTEHKHNSPWNIASPFDVDISFSPDDIAGMLTDYENNHNTGMNIAKISQLIYDYTSGYPVLVGEFCKNMDESSNWNEQGIIEANKQILIRKHLFQKNTSF